MNRTSAGLAWGLFLALAAGCQLVPSFHSQKSDKVDPEALAPPSKFSARVPPFAFMSDVEISTNQPMFKELSQLREKVFKELQLPSSNAVVQVFLFEDKDRYQRFMQSKYPDLPKRRAFFVAQPHRLGGGEDLLVYTFWGDKTQQDLRHELTHSLLHSVLKSVPLWLDEGLAEYFEMPPGWNGVNYQHLLQLRQSLESGQKTDLARLEGLTEVNQMNHAEYRESWAWVHFMLHNPETRPVLRKYLQELRTNVRPSPLQPRLAAVVPSLDSALERHLAGLDLNKEQGASNR